jgi:hypothetical protein
VKLKPSAFEALSEQQQRDQLSSLFESEYKFAIVRWGRREERTDRFLITQVTPVTNYMAEVLEY